MKYVQENIGKHFLTLASVLTMGIWLMESDMLWGSKPVLCAQVCCPGSLWSPAHHWK